MELLRVRALVGSTVENLEDRVQLLELLRVERVHHPARTAWPEPLPETLNEWVATPQPPHKRHDRLVLVPLSVLERSPRPPLDQTSPPYTEHQGLTAPAKLLLQSLCVNRAKVAQVKVRSQASL